MFGSFWNAFQQEVFARSHYRFASVCRRMTDEHKEPLKCFDHQIHETIDTYFTRCNSMKITAMHESFAGYATLSMGFVS